MTLPLRALIVEDSQNDCDLLLSVLDRGGYQVTHKQVCNAATLLAALDEPWDIVISDYSMPGFKGTDALAMIRNKGLDIPFVFLSGTIGEEIAVNAMRAGAQDYVIKGNAARLLPAIQRELRESEVRRDRKLMERRVRQLEKFEALGKLAGGVAHDFNNVIGAIMGWAEIGVDRMSMNSPDAARLFRNIQEQASKAAGLTRQLLAYARRQVLEPKNTSLNELVNDTATMLEKIIGEQIEVKMVLASDLQVTRADPSQIEQVLMNLCFNARDAMPKGGQLLIETRNIELDSLYCKQHPGAQPGRYVRLSVSDTGSGMDATTLGRIFEPFFTTKEIGKGTGLGLATVLGIVNQHAGFVDVYSEIDKGTAFHVYLPACEGVAEPLRHVDDAPVRGGGETILIAEDHEGMREMAHEILEGLGYQLHIARDGEEAVQQFLGHKTAISLVLLDVIMPKLSGTDAYERICNAKPGVPVIFTSGYSDHGPLLESLAAKGASILQKPYSSKVLSRRVRDVLDHFKATQTP